MGCSWKRVLLSVHFRENTGSCCFQTSVLLCTFDSLQEMFTYTFASHKASRYFPWLLFWSIRFRGTGFPPTSPYNSLPGLRATFSSVWARSSNARLASLSPRYWLPLGLSFVGVSGPSDGKGRNRILKRQQLFPICIVIHTVWFWISVSLQICLGGKSWTFSKFLSISHKNHKMVRQ